MPAFKIRYKNKANKNIFYCFFIYLCRYLYFFMWIQVTIVSSHFSLKDYLDYCNFVGQGASNGFSPYFNFSEAILMFLPFLKNFVGYRIFCLVLLYFLMGG